MGVALRRGRDLSWTEPAHIPRMVIPGFSKQENKLSVLLYGYEFLYHMFHFNVVFYSLSFKIFLNED